jgi:hypothetical protein
MGLALNTPVVDCEFSSEYARHWVALNKARDKFEHAVAAYASDGEEVAGGRWRAVKRRLGKLCREINKCAAFADARIKSPEGGLLALFINDRAMPYAEYWASALAALDDGAVLTIRHGDIPEWFDPI